MGYHGLLETGVAADFSHVLAPFTQDMIICRRLGFANEVKNISYTGS